MARKRGPTLIRQTPDRPMTEEDTRLAAEAAAYAASDAAYTQYEEAAGDEDPGPPPTVDEAIAALTACGDPERAVQAAGYHKIPRRYLGVPVPLIEDQVRLWRAQASVAERVALARDLWASGIHEAMVAAAKLLTQARMRPDDAAWALICDWVTGIDGWAVADQACSAGGRRLLADPRRIETVEGWLTSDNIGTRRAALVVTLPFTRSNHPTTEERAIRARVLGWCLRLAPERDWFMQKAIGDWLRDLSKHDADAVRDWLAAHGAMLKPFACKEAARYLR